MSIFPRTARQLRDRDDGSYTKGLRQPSIIDQEHGTYRLYSCNSDFIVNIRLQYGSSTRYVACDRTPKYPRTAARARDTYLEIRCKVTNDATICRVPVRRLLSCLGGDTTSTEYLPDCDVLSSVPTMVQVP
ncbi:hypothetical protein CHU98_g7319 [Xylaria longipes]|nr:hypothetical protein CHU98_g7319 [Xylaria longipes]